MKAGALTKQLPKGVEMHPREIKLVPNLSIATLWRGLNKELAMWYCLRAINCWGSGRLETQIAVNVLKFWSRYSKSTAYIVYKDGVKPRSKRPKKNINSLQIEIYGVKRGKMLPRKSFRRISIRNSDSEVCVL